MGMQAHQRNHSHSHRYQFDPLKALLLLHIHRFWEIFRGVEKGTDKQKCVDKETYRGMRQKDIEKTKKKKKAEDRIDGNRQKFVGGFGGVNLYIFLNHVLHKTIKFNIGMWEIL